MPATFSWQLGPWGPWTIAQEVQILLLVLITGAFGSCVYALKCFADYLGQAKLNEGWFAFYVVQPFEGAGIAFLLYLVIRGGFLGGTGADVKNPFGICAIAGLAGAFSDMAFAKLREVFETLFKPKDDRSGKISPIRISPTTLPDVDATNKVAYNQTLHAIGGTTPYKWSVAPDLPKGLALDPATGAITGTPATVTPKGKYTFKVTDSDGASATSEFQIAVT